jgi:DNA-binding protein HU-beta
MNKKELIEQVAAQAEIPKTTAAKALTTMIDSVIATVAKDDTVVLPGFGTFKSSKRAARTGRHPKSGDLLENAFARLKQYRAIATRYDKLKRNYESMVAIACAYLWLPM